MNDQHAMIDAYLDGDLEVAQFARLAEVLASDESLIHQLADRAELIINIRRALQRRRATSSPMLSTRPDRGRSVGVWAVLAAAAAIALAAGVWFAFLPESRTPKPEPSGASPAVAMLSDLSPGSMLAGAGLTPTPAIGGDLAAGALHLASGKAQILFRSGAVVDMVGPCEFAMTGPNRGTLTTGLIEAYVPPGARRFTIDTPTGLRVVDLGTRFTLQSGGDPGDPATGQRVRVIEGVVLVEFAGQIATLGAAQMAYLRAGRLIVTASDSFGPGDSILVDFGLDGSAGSNPAGALSPDHWNNVARDTNGAFGSTARLVKQAVRFDDGAPTGVDITFNADPGVNFGIGALDDPTTLSAMPQFPVSATRDTLYFTAASPDARLNLIITGLNPALRYHLTLFGRVPADATRPVTIWIVGDQTLSYSPTDNHDPVTFTALRPQPDGSLTLAATRGPSPVAAGHLNLMKIQAVAPDGLAEPFKNEAAPLKEIEP